MLTNYLYIFVSEKDLNVTNGLSGSVRLYSVPFVKNFSFSKLYNFWGRYIDNNVIFMFNDAFVGRQAFLCFYNSSSLNKLYFGRLKLKGLGYRISRYGKYVFKFFLGLNHYIYWYVPLFVFVTHKKKKLMLFSFDRQKLFLVFWELLSIKRLSSHYKGMRSKGFIRVKLIRFLKKLKLRQFG